MKKAGIILICLQAVAFLGGIANGSLANMFSSGSSGLIQLIGFCLPAIIGIVLIIKANKKSKSKQ